MALVEYAVADGVAHIELNRPEAANVVDLPTSRAFGAAVARAAEDTGVRAVLLTGAGPRFCAGGDVSSFVAADDQPAYLHELALDLDGAAQALAAIDTRKGLPTRFAQVRQGISRQSARNFGLVDPSQDRRVSPDGDGPVRQVRDVVVALTDFRS